MADPSTPEEGIKDLLVLGSIGVFNVAGSWQIVIGKFIDKPDQQICITGTGGKTPNPRWNIDYPSVQVRVRGGINDWLAVRAKAREIKDLLLGKPSFDLNSDRWTAINMIGDITPMGFEPQTSRPIFAVNFALIIEPSDMGNRES